MKSLAKINRLDAWPSFVFAILSKEMSWSQFWKRNLVQTKNNFLFHHPQQLAFWGQNIFVNFKAQPIKLTAS